MESPDDIIETKIFNVETMIKGLKIAFPNVEYIALNAKISDVNASEWTNEWYAVGFEYAPYLVMIDGYYSWAANEEIRTGIDEEAVFFLHFISNNWAYKDELLQTSPSEFMNAEELCFTFDENGNVIQYKDETHYVEYFNFNEEQLTQVMGGVQ